MHYYRSDDSDYSCSCPYPYHGDSYETRDYCMNLERAYGNAIRCHTLQSTGIIMFMILQ